MSGAPARLSVIIPSVNGWDHLGPCLEALSKLGVECAMEVIVVERCGESVRTRLAATHPGVRIVPVVEATPIPWMRAIGLRAANAKMLAVIEDHVIAPVGWARAILEARSAGRQVVGGPVVNAARSTAADRAAFLCEYSATLAMRPAGPATGLAGNNTAYDRAIVTPELPLLDQGAWEDELHAAIVSAGAALWFEPALTAGHARHYASASEYMRERFIYSRAWASRRLRNSGLPWRLVRGAGSVLLPPLLMARIGARVWRSTSRRELLPALPYLVVFTCAWAAGELAGAWFGDGGAAVSVR